MEMQVTVTSCILLNMVVSFWPGDGAGVAVAVVAGVGAGVAGAGAGAIIP